MTALTSSHAVVIVILMETNTIDRTDTDNFTLDPEKQIWLKTDPGGWEPTFFLDGTFDMARDSGECDHDWWSIPRKDWEKLPPTFQGTAGQLFEMYRNVGDAEPVCCAKAMELSRRSCFTFYVGTAGL